MAVVAGGGLFAASQLKSGNGVGILGEDHTPAHMFTDDEVSAAFPTAAEVNSLVKPTPLMTVGDMDGFSDPKNSVTPSTCNTLSGVWASEYTPRPESAPGVGFSNPDISTIATFIFSRFNSSDDAAAAGKSVTENWKSCSGKVIDSTTEGIEGNHPFRAHGLTDTDGITSMVIDYDNVAWSCRRSVVVTLT